MTGVVRDKPVFRVVKTPDGWKWWLEAKNGFCMAESWLTYTRRRIEDAQRQGRLIA